MTKRITIIYYPEYDEYCWRIARRLAVSMWKVRVGVSDPRYKANIDKYGKELLYGPRCRHGNPLMLLEMAYEELQREESWRWNYEGEPEKPNLDVLPPPPDSNVYTFLRDLWGAFIYREKGIFDPKHRKNNIP